MRQVKKQLQNPGANIALFTESVKLTSDNWKNHDKPGLICNIQINPPKAQLPIPPPPPPKAQLPIPLPPPPPSIFVSVYYYWELFEQRDGASITIPHRQYCNQSAVVTRKQASDSSLGGLGRLWKCLEGVQYERWVYSDGSRVSSGRPKSDRRVIFLDTGLAFRGKPVGQVLGFCLIQESMLEVNPTDLGLSDGVSGTPIYRVRNFDDAEEAKRYMFADATEQCIGTVGSYYVVAKGTQVGGLFCKKIGQEVVWI